MRLLVVEDDEALGRVLKRGLVEEGYAVDLVTHLIDARHAAETTPYDLVILDLGLPDGNGLTLCEELRDRREATPVLILTARDGVTDRVAGLDAGADDYLTKPFDFRELSARTRALLRRPADTHQPVVLLGDIELDPASRTVSRSGLPVQVTTREFAVLEQLMRRPGEVVSRTHLIDHVWDGDYDGLSNVVDVHVAALRRKLSEHGGAVPIATVRGAGYRFDAEPEAVS